ncbi:MAG: hypothetical protein AAF430_09190 [Myxococcota bacterium]
MTHSIWYDEKAIFDALVVLTDETVYVANPTAKQGAELKARLDAGEPPRQVLKDEGQRIPLASLTRIRWDQKSDDIDLDYREGKEKDSKNITFERREWRDAFAAELQQAHADWEAKTVEYSVFRAILGPAVFGAFVAGVTWLLHLAAVEIAAGESAEISGRHALVKKLLALGLEWVGPAGVLVIGGLMLAATVFVLGQRAGDPPIVTTLRPPR